MTYYRHLLLYKIIFLLVVVNNSSIYAQMFYKNKNLTCTSTFCLSSNECKKAKLIILNKITCKAKEVLFDVGLKQYYENINILVHKCIKIGDENAMLISISESKLGQDSKQVFQGWLFSSNISISCCEHPTYEIFAKKCYE